MQPTGQKNPLLSALLDDDDDDDDDDDREKCTFSVLQIINNVTLWRSRGSVR